MHIQDVMTRGVECVTPDATLQEAAHKMKALNVGSMPVCENDRAVGMLTDRDVTVRATAAGKDPTSARVRDAMTRSVLYCYEDDDVAIAARLMKDHQVRRLLVLNRERRLVGIVTLGDLAGQGGDDPLTGDTLEGVSQPATPANP